MEPDVPAEQREAFGLALRVLNEAQVPYVIGGAFAVYFHTGFWRNTKDMDLFLLPRDVRAAVARLSEAGFRTRMQSEYWLAKAFMNDYMIDLIFGEGNWLRPVDQHWLDRSWPCTLFDVPVRVAAIEELITSKAYVAGRERFDGADITHLILASRGRLDWMHLLSRFDGHWQLLFSYLNLFQFVYPSDRDLVPDWLLAEMSHRLRRMMHEPPPEEKVCRGTLLDRFSYTYDIMAQGYTDPRERLAVEKGFDVLMVVEDRIEAQRVLRTRRLGEAEEPHSPEVEQ